jgi:hypothetical protein
MRPGLRSRRSARSHRTDLRRLPGTGRGDRVHDLYLYGLQLHSDPRLVHRPSTASTSCRPSPAPPSRWVRSTWRTACSRTTWPRRPAGRPTPHWKRSSSSSGSPLGEWWRAWKPIEFDPVGSRALTCERWQASRRLQQIAVQKGSGLGVSLGPARTARGRLGVAERPAGVRWVGLAFDRLTPPTTTVLERGPIALTAAKSRACTPSSIGSPYDYFTEEIANPGWGAAASSPSPSNRMRVDTLVPLPRAGEAAPCLRPPVPPDIDPGNPRLPEDTSRSAVSE